MMMRVMTVVAGVVLAVGAVVAQEDAAVDEAAVSSEAPVVESIDVSQVANQVMQGDLSAGLPILEKYVLPVVFALLILIITYFLAKGVSRSVRRPIEAKVDKTLGTFVGKFVFYIIMLIGILGVLGKFGISVASFAAVLGAAGFAIGLAFQGTLSNFSSGILLLVFRPFKVGDVVSAGGVTAKVEEIDLFTTIFQTVDNRRIIVPNSAIAAGTIENMSYHSERRVDVAVGVEYTASLDKTRAVLTEAAESMTSVMVQGEGRGYQIYLGDLGDSAVGWTVRLWVKAEDYWSAKEDLTAAVKNHLDEARIGIPFPQMDVHVFKSSDG